MTGLVFHVNVINMENIIADNNKQEDYFPSLVGQQKARNKLKLLVDLQHDTGIFPPLLITGQRGSGKNQTAFALSKVLYPVGERYHKKIVEINCASIKNESQFFDEIVNQYILDKSVTLILDEFHALHKTSLIDTFLSIWNTKDTYLTSYMHGGQSYDFDLRKISWIALTSEPHLIPETLITRLEVIQLEELTVNELSTIVANALRDIKIDKETLEEIAQIGRNNGRECYKLGETLYRYSQANKLDYLSKDNWKSLKYQLGLRDMGVNNIEYRILSFLNKNGNSSLTRLSSGLQLTGAATRGAFERYLLANNLMKIEAASQRSITHLGKKYLEANPE